MLVSSRDERHIADALVRLGTQTDLIGRSVTPNVPAAVADLAQRLAPLPERSRLLVLKVIRCGTRLALWCLYPQPRATCIENQLMRFPLAAEIHGREDLNVEEV